MKDLPTGPKDVCSTTLSIEEEAIIVAFRRYTLLPLDDCLYALQATIPHLTRSSLHRCLQRHEISRLPEVTGDKEPKRMFKTYSIGYLHIDIAEVRTAEGKLYLYVAIDFVIYRFLNSLTARSRGSRSRVSVESSHLHLQSVEGSCRVSAQRPAHRATGMSQAAFWVANEAASSARPMTAGNAALGLRAPISMLGRASRTARRSI